MIAPAAKSVEAERTAIAAELELSAGQALVAQAGTAADSRQAARTAPMTRLGHVSAALGSAAPVAPTPLCSKFESGPASNHLVETGSAATAGYYSAHPTPGGTTDPNELPYYWTPPSSTLL
ncbi:hypothetical protein PC123_g14227 [Phytophthora cactorum]|nr:hypothetical protein PC123_g14227 [Phytophthora cactorum]